jgi:hypothetical protein
VSAVLLAGALAGAPALAGATKPPFTIALASAAAVALVTLYATRRTSSVYLPAFALPLMALALLTLLQVLPLPPLLFGFVTPTAAHVNALTERDLASRPWHCISRDLAASLNDAAKLFGAVCVAMLVIRWGNSESRRRWLSFLLMATLVVLLAATFFLSLLSRESDVAVSRSALRFPFINPNHAATLIAMLAPLVIRLAANAHGVGRAIVIGLLIVANAALLSTLSRAGITIGVLTQFLALVVVARRSESQSASAAIAACALVAAGMIFVAFWLRVDDPNKFGRVHAWQDATMLVRDFWRAGVGTGAFVYVFPSYSRAVGVRFAFVENEYLQLFCDLGVIGACGVASAFVVALVRSFSNRRREVTTGMKTAMLGLLALLAHSTVDFAAQSFAILGVAVTLSVLAFPSATFRVSKTVAFAVAALTLILSVLSFSQIGRSAEADALLLMTYNGNDLRATATRLFLRHPADAFLCDVAAARLMEKQDTEAFRWLDRALLLNPKDATAHRLTARALAKAGRAQQASLELATAVQLDPDGLTATIDEAIRIFSQDTDAVLLRRVAPPDSRGYRTLLARLLDAHRWRQIGVVGKELPNGVAADPEVCHYLVYAALANHDKAAALRAADELMGVDHSTNGVLLAARAYAEGDRRDRAREILASTWSKQEEPTIAVALAPLLADSNQFEDARAILDEALRISIDAKDKVAVHLARADVEARNGRVNRAAYEREEAARLESQ